ncbi:MAG: hypothetical protein ACXAC7_05445 [Candidatus Hodarchaeales archaeon]|jgi:hypothetical protein
MKQGTIDLDILKSNLDSKTFDIELWKKEFSVFSDLDLSQVIKLLVTYLNDNPQTYLPFLNILWEVFSSDESHQTILFVLFHEILDINVTWLCKFLENVLPNESNFVYEELFNLLSMTPSAFHIDQKSSIIQILRKMANHDLLFLTELYLLQENKVNLISDQHLQLLPHVSEKYQLDFIPFLFKFRNTKTIDFIKKHIFSLIPPFTMKFRLCIILHSLSFPEIYYSKINELLGVIREEIDDFFNESIILEIIQPEFIKNKWIEQIVKFYASHEDVKWRKNIIRYSGQHIGQWQPKSRQILTILAKDPSPEVRIEFSRIFSQFWIDEKLIEDLLDDKDMGVIESLLLNITSLFLDLSKELRERILFSISNLNKLKYLRGYIIGYNYTDSEFSKEVEKNLDNPNNIDSSFGYLIEGLASHWNYLPINYREIIINSSSKWPNQIKNQLANCLARRSGLLDEEGLKLLKALSESFELLSIDEIELVL